jgi:hypothetical protein
MLPKANSQFDGGGKLDIGSALGLIRSNRESRLRGGYAGCWILDICTFNKI